MTYKDLQLYVNQRCLQTKKVKQCKERPNHGVQLTPLARPLGWARFTRQNATASYQCGNPQPPAVQGEPTSLALQRSAARALPGSCLCPPSSTLHTPTSGAADVRR